MILLWVAEARAGEPPSASLGDEPAGFVPSPEDVAATLEELGDVVQIGASRDGEPILARRFGEGPRALRVVGGHHGDEGSSIVVTLAVARALAERGVPDGTEVWVVPLLNPDGARAYTRANADGVDLNRNYGWEWAPDEAGAGPAPFSEPETRAMRALARARDFGGGVTVHSGASNIGWPWNWTTAERVVDEPLFEQIAADYAAACGAPDFWITNGGDWYVTPGEETDWTYGSAGAYDLTLEVSTVKSPPEDEVPTYVGWHVDAVLALLARLPGREGVATDAVTGEPIPALVTGEGKGDAWTGPDGRFARWGEGEMVAWAPGYAAAPLGEPLVPTSIVPGPSRLVSHGGGEIALDGAGVLSMPGEADVAFSGAVDPALLAPGAWTITTDAGTTPRALFVGEVDDRVAIAEAVADGDRLTVRGRGFGAGAEAWSIGGPARAMRALSRVEEADDTLVFTLGDDAEDVLVWTSGAWLSIVDVRGEAIVDDPAAADMGLQAHGGCAGERRWLAGVLLLGLRRRRPTGGRGACGLP
jgi:hypothetical protein